MALGIDPATTLRLSDSEITHTLYGARGIAPCWSHALDILWSNRRVQRQSNYEGIISFHNAWHSLMNEDNTAFRFQVEGQLLTKPWDALIAEAFRSLIRAPT